ncbi:hypothetical protein JCM8547_006612 [Rhodosporidiobolus lusitaniae]
MPVPAAVQLRIALALVLLEHKPPHLSLQDYLERLKKEVRSRLGRPNAAGDSTPARTGREEGRRADETVAREAARNERDEGEASTTAAPPSFPPPMLLQLVMSAQDELDSVLPFLENEQGEAKAATAFTKQAKLLSWVVERAGELTTSIGGDERLVGDAEEEELTQEDLSLALSTLLTHFFPLILPHSPLHHSLATLLVRLTSTFPFLAVERVFPVLLEGVGEFLSALASGGSHEEREGQEGQLDALLSLSRIFFSSLPPTLSSLGRSTTLLEAVQRAVNRLTLVVTTLEVEALFEEEGREELEARVLGLMECCWAVVEVLEAE